MVTRRIRRSKIRVSAGLCVFAWVLATWGGPATPTEDDVRNAAERIYVHGMTREIAETAVGPAGAPALVRLLWDESFERRDNVVALLGFLGDGDVVHELIRFMADPPFSRESPAEDRALLLIPEALGHLASRGVEPAALQELMTITADGSDASGDRIEMAVRGLMFSGRPEARTRLADLAERRIAPRGGYDPAPVARALLDWLEASSGTDGASAAPTARSGADAKEADSSTAGQPPVGAGFADPDALDPNDAVHQSWIDYANHVSLSTYQRMNDERLDEVLDSATILLGYQDFAEDLICCATMARAGTAGQFGSPGDGLDVATTVEEINEVINDPAARFKVIRQIGWCGGGPVTNAIGCAHIQGYGVAVVRYGTTEVRREGALWLHEFGHNVGLTHVNDIRYFMYPTITGNGGTSSGQCLRFHGPPAAAAVAQLEIGACSDDDVDGIHAVIDNCPDAANVDQLDGDADHVGNVCDNCVMDANPGQEDGDADLVGDVCDNCPSVANPGQADYDRDQLGDACESGVTLADADHSGRVDGFDLARLARALGSVIGDARYDRHVDLTWDGRVDGEDLAIMAFHFGQTAGWGTAT